MTIVMICHDLEVSHDNSCLAWYVYRMFYANMMACCLRQRSGNIFVPGLGTFGSSETFGTIFAPLEEFVQTHGASGWNCAGLQEWQVVHVC